MSNQDCDLLGLSVREFLNRAASRTPTPGGGSVAALVGALAATMAQMTARYTAGNPKYAQHEAAIGEWIAELGRAQAAFCELLAEDVAAYERFAAAGKSGDDRAKALATATAVPLEIAAMAGALAESLDRMKERCNRNLLSDLAVGAVLCEAAASSAASNVRVNLAQFADREEADRIACDLESVLVRTRQHRDRVVGFADTRR